MNPFDRLGVGVDADTAAIKVAYAKQLRLHRPDEDPAGFQLVHDAFTVCMAHAQRRAQQAQAMAQAKSLPNADANPLATKPDSLPARIEPVASSSQAAHPPRPLAATPATTPVQAHHATPAATSQPAPVADDNSPEPRKEATAPVAQPTVAPIPPTTASAGGAAPPVKIFSVREFVAAVMERDRGGPVVLGHWLQHHEPLYQVSLKRAITPDLLELLAAQRVPLSPDGLDVVLRFFALDTVGPDWNVFGQRVQFLQSRSRAAWWLRTNAELQPQDTRIFGRKPGNRRAPWSQRIVDDELTTPSSFWRRVAILLFPAARKQLHARMLEISGDPILANAPMFAQGGVAFWKRVFDPSRASPWRLVPAAAYVLLVILASFVFLFATASDFSAGVMLGYGISGLLVLLMAYASLLIAAARFRRRRAPRVVRWRERFAATDLYSPRNLGRRAVILLIPGFKGPMRWALDALAPRAGVSGSKTPNEDAVAFWSRALDPQRVSGWRLLAQIFLLVVLFTALALWLDDMAYTATLAALGIGALGGWVILAWNDAIKARSVAMPGAQTRQPQPLPKNPDSWVKRLGRVRPMRPNKARWIIAAILAINALVHLASQINSR